MEHIQNSL